MDQQAGQKPEGRRRSARIILRIPLLLNVATTSPETAWEHVETILVSQHGGMLRARQGFQVGATLDLRLRNQDRSALARVAWTSRTTSEDTELGFEIIDQNDFWDMKIPPDC